MPKTKAQKKDKARKIIQATVNSKLWGRIRVQAIKEDRTTGRVLDTAIIMYLQTVKK